MLQCYFGTDASRVQADIDVDIDDTGDESNEAVDATEVDSVLSDPTSPRSLSLSPSTPTSPPVHTLPPTGSTGSSPVIPSPIFAYRSANDSTTVAGSCSGSGSGSVACSDAGASTSVSAVVADSRVYDPSLARLPSLKSLAINSAAVPRQIVYFNRTNTMINSAAVPRQIVYLNRTNIMITRSTNTNYRSIGFIPELIQILY